MVVFEQDKDERNMFQDLNDDIDFDTKQVKNMSFETEDEISNEERKYQPKKNLLYRNDITGSVKKPKRIIKVKQKPP